MSAPERFVEWMSGHVANDKKFGRKIFHYHPRSDEHSKMICRFVLDDLIERCPMLAAHAASGEVVGGINVPFTFPNGKKKTLDLAVGPPAERKERFEYTPPITEAPIASVRIACEAKQCMTEHAKSQPRIFDELSSSHEIVHQGDTEAIAAAIVVVNIADQYASPTRQRSKRGKLVVTTHRQPDVTKSMVNHLRGLIVRDEVGQVGFDALATVVINCENMGGACTLHVDSPAPQPGEQIHYDSFIERISVAYNARFSE